jgi:hypothetical protein
MTVSRSWVWPCRPVWRWPESPPVTSSSATPRSARDGYQRLLLHAEFSGEMGLTAAALEGLARAALTDGDPTGAAELLARAAAIRDTHDRPASPGEAAATAATVAAMDRALSETSTYQGNRAKTGQPVRGSGG